MCTNIPTLASIQSIEKLVKKIFLQDPMKVERVKEGGSTCIYRIHFPHETFYLRVLPEEEASFAPEVAVHMQLSQMHVKVPEAIYFEHFNELLQRSVMVTTEIKGQPISQSATFSEEKLREIVEEAGQDLARLNSVPVEGFGWVRRDQSETETRRLRAEQPTQRVSVLKYWREDLAYLAEHALQVSELALLERVFYHYESWLDSEQGYLAHGDFDTTHIYQNNGRYTGIIDFGEIRGADRWYDLGHFHLRDGELLSIQFLPALISGYSEITSLPFDYERHIRFAALLINVRILTRSLQKRPPNRYTQHQLKVLREDLVALLQ
jgi:aminoglycoside phosphotransferase (APT) family kinase protein